MGFGERGSGNARARERARLAGGPRRAASHAARARARPVAAAGQPGGQAARWSGNHEPAGRRSAAASAAGGHGNVPPVPQRWGRGQRRCAGTERATACADRPPFPPLRVPLTRSRAPHPRPILFDPAFPARVRAPDALDAHPRARADPRAAVTSRVEAFYKEQHERQTVEFVRAMEARYTPAPARRAPGMPRMGVWEAAELLDTIIDDSDPDTSLSQIEHCMQTAEALRAAFPGEEHGWLHLTGFIHDLGKVLAHPAFGCLPQWAVVGDTYPVACAPDPLVVYHEHFAGCPDARVEAYARKHGVYSPGCGLDNVHMSWGHDEYIYRVLRAHAPCVLPPEALFICRYHSFYALHQHGAYEWMLTAEERHTMLPWLRTFQRFDLYSKVRAPFRTRTPPRARAFAR